MRNLIKYLLQGVLLIAPLALTVLILVKIFTLLDSLIPKDLIILGDTKIGDIPGLGILLLLLILVITGVFGSTFIASPVQHYFQKALKKAPLIKLVYSSVKDILGAFVGNKKKFKNPVLIKESDQTNLNRIGFVTQTDLTSIGIAEGFTSVYIPHAYAISGMLFIVENKYIQPLDVPAGEAMKFIITGGVLNKEENEENN